MTLGAPVYVFRPIFSLTPPSSRARKVAELTGLSSVARVTRQLLSDATAPAWVLLVVLAALGCRRQETGPEPEPASGADVRPVVAPRRPLSPAQAHAMMLEELREIRASTGETIEWLGDAKAIGMRRRVAEAEQSQSLPQQYAMRGELAELELRLGNEREAIELLLGCQQLIEPTLQEMPKEKAAALANDLEFMLGVAYMRLAETQNCCNRHTPESCVVPIRGTGLHANAYGATEATRCFERVLQRATPNSTAWLRALWLYNIAHMTLGQYPDKVPEQWRVPAEAFADSQEFPNFANASQGQGLDTFSLAGGAIADDFNGDGRLDIVASNSDTDGQIRFFENHHGKFADSTRSAGLIGLLGGLNLVQTDYDNDGFLDVLVLRGGWFQTGGRHPNSLLHNNGDGTFSDVTFSANLRSRAPTQTASWADYDNDGDLDLYIGNETTRTVPIYSELFRNNADGTFTDVAGEAGVRNNRFTKAVVWGDYDHDGLPDIYVSNFGQANRLYRNQGDGTFVDEAQRLGVTGPLRSFPVWFWDFNNDGALDLFVTSYVDDISWLAAHALDVQPLDAPYEIEPPALYQGNGGGSFSHVSERYQLTAPTSPMGSNFGDLDHDGFLDFYLGTGEPEYQNLMPNVMYHNQQGKGFADVTMAGRFGHLQKGHAVVFADLDQDGDQDVFEQLGGAYPGDGFYDALFENPGFGNSWIVVRLVGRQSNRAALGARLHLRVKQGDSTRSIYKHVNSGGSFGANPLEQSIGIGAAKQIESLEIFWPTTGKTQVFRDLPANQAIRIVEGTEEHTKLPR